MKESVALGFGGNLAEPIPAIDNAIQHLRKTQILTDLRISHYYRTEPWGNAEGGAFVNATVTGNTNFAPDELLDILQVLETKAGRVRSGKRYEARVLDIDILLYGNRIITNERLTIPHPLLSERRFVLVPLAEIAEDWIVPTLHTTVGLLLEECRDVATIERIEDARGTGEPS